MNLTIDQPTQWQLKESCISIILEDLPTMLNMRHSIRATPRVESVEILDEYYGLKFLVGPKLTTKLT